MRRRAATCSHHPEEVEALVLPHHPLQRLRHLAPRVPLESQSLTPRSLIHRPALYPSREWRQPGAVVGAGGDRRGWRDAAVSVPRLFRLRSHEGEARWRFAGGWQRGDSGALYPQLRGSVKGSEFQDLRRCPALSGGVKSRRSVELDSRGSAQAEEGGYVAFNPETGTAKARASPLMSTCKTCARRHLCI